MWRDLKCMTCQDHRPQFSLQFVLVFTVSVCQGWMPTEVNDELIAINTSLAGWPGKHSRSIWPVMKYLSY